MDTTQRTASISVTAPISVAYDRMHRIVFGPFNMEKWFVMGFCAFLAGLGRVTPPKLVNLLHRPMPMPPAGGMPPQFRQLMAQNAELIAWMVPCVTAGMLFLWPLLRWLGARGDFMLLDGVVHDRAAVTEPWHAFAKQANSLFVTRLIFGLVIIGAELLTGGVALLVAMPGGRGRLGMGGTAVLAVLAAAALGVVVAVVFVLGDCILTDFIAPIMYRRGLSTMAAVDVFRRELLPGRICEFVLFYLMKIALSILILVCLAIALTVTCCGCGLALLPYISTVLLLPLFVFFRCYSLCFLEQFGPQWQFFDVEPQAAQPAVP